MNIKVIKLILITAIVMVCAETKAQDKWEMADIATVRLTPKEFKDLPKAIVSDLEKRNCTVPQSYPYTEKHNVINGEFKRKGQKDWAVLCSLKMTSTILIYWNGSTGNVSKIGTAEDKGFLQTVDSKKIGFSRIIGVVDAKYIDDHYRSYGGPKPPKITHNGINDAFAEKASVVLYLHKGKWLELQGAD